jgi:hypothetical protein
MKTKLTPKNLPEFRSRFGTFHDSVIHRMQHDMFTGYGAGNMKIIIGTFDIQDASRKNWFNLVLDIEGVSEYIIIKRRNHYDGIIYRLNVDFFDDEIYFDFVPRTESPTQPDDYTGNIQVNSKELVIVARKCFWSVEPYEELARQ